MKSNKQINLFAVICIAHIGESADSVAARTARHNPREPIRGANCGGVCRTLRDLPGGREPEARARRKIPPHATHQVWHIDSGREQNVEAIAARAHHNVVEQVSAGHANA